MAQCSDRKVEITRLKVCSSLLLVAIDIVAIQLYGETTTLGMVDRQVPTPADTQIVPFGQEMQQARVLFGQCGDFLGRTVGRMVIHDDDVIVEIRCLPQGGTDRVLDRTDPVTNRDYNASIVRTRLRTGIITDASRGKSVPSNSISLVTGGK